MGQKVNPHGLRVGIIKDWDSKWYAESDFADYLVEDYNIRKFLKKKLYSAGISRIEIERASDRVKVIIYTAKPGVVIGKGGSEIEKVKAELAKYTDKKLIVGYRDERFLEAELSHAGELHVATEDGSFGVKGNVLDVIRQEGLSADVIFACGPTPMLRAIKAYAQEQGIPCWISMEERMACGIGACLACVCQSKEVDSHSQVHNKRICKDGPVFLASEVEL